MNSISRFNSSLHHHVVWLADVARYMILNVLVKPHIGTYSFHIYFLLMLLLRVSIQFVAPMFLFIKKWKVNVCVWMNHCYIYVYIYMTWRGSAKRSGTKSLLRCVQTWCPTTRSVWPLWLPTKSAGDQIIFSHYIYIYIYTYTIYIYTYTIYIYKPIKPIILMKYTFTL